jgi:hypothetical protein
MNRFGPLVPVKRQRHNWHKPHIVNYVLILPMLYVTFGGFFVEFCVFRIAMLVLLLYENMNIVYIMIIINILMYDA